MVMDSYTLPGGGVSKVNIATDLELAFLGAIGVTARGTEAWCAGLDAATLEIGRKAVYNEVCNKICNYLRSNNKAW